MCPFARHSHLQPRLCILAILHVSNSASCGSLLSCTVLRGCPDYSSIVLSKFDPDSGFTHNWQGTGVCERDINFCTVYFWPDSIVYLANVHVWNKVACKTSWQLWVHPFARLSFLQPWLVLKPLSCICNLGVSLCKTFTFAVQVIYIGNSSCL